MGNPSPAKAAPRGVWGQSGAPVFVAGTDFLPVKPDGFVVARLANAVCDMTQAVTCQDDANPAVINQRVTSLPCLIL